ncbi:MAG: hypothetical protein U0I22_01655 [Treponema sp.]|nr:hypothetical protein [Treponema sp.]
MTNEIMTTKGGSITTAAFNSLEGITSTALKSFEEFTGQLFQSIATCSANRNERKVRIAKINAELQAYLAKEENNLKLKSGGMTVVQQTYEGQLNRAELTFEERKELLNQFSGYILQIVGCC